MAIYHFSVQLISRSQGRSVCAAAAYRSACRIHDERQGLTYDYSRKGGVEFSDIMLPEGAPTEYKNRALLWNAVEACERRKDAQLAREINVSLPRELPYSANLKLITEFVKYHFVDNGMIADVAIHNDISSDGEAQPHAHIMLTTRAVSPDGFGPKIRDWNNKDYLNLWREEWAHIANRYLIEHGINELIDNRSFKAQGIDLIPQSKIGPANAKGELARMEEHLRIADRNAKKIIRNPAIAISILTKHFSTFTYRDVARLVNRHSVDKAQFDEVFEKIMQHEGVLYLGKDEVGQKRFTSYEINELEKNMFYCIRGLSKHTENNISWFNRKRTLAKYSLSPEQQQAYQHLTETGGIKCLIGLAGTGKSYLLGAAREAWERQGYRVIGTSLSAISSYNLEESAKIHSRTIRSLLSRLESPESNFRLTNKDVLVIDEAAMVDTRLMQQLISYATRAQAKVILVGDECQLQAIEAGAPFRAICEEVGAFSLTDVRRQKDWQREASIKLAYGKFQEAFKLYEKHGRVQTAQSTDKAFEAVTAAYMASDRTQDNLILANRRDDIAMLNSLVRAERVARGEVHNHVKVETSRGEKSFGVNDKIVFLANDKELDVRNGSRGTIKLITKDLIIASLDAEKRDVAFYTNEYNHIDHGYATTVYKSQGLSLDNTFVYLNKDFNMHTSYVALTRHKESTKLFYAKSEFKNTRSLGERLSRHAFKELSIDYNRDGKLEEIPDNAQHKVKSNFIEKVFERFNSKERLSYAEIRERDAHEVRIAERHSVRLERQRQIERAKERDKELGINHSDSDIGW